VQSAENVSNIRKLKQSVLIKSIKSGITLKGGDRLEGAITEI